MVGSAVQVGGEIASFTMQIGMTAAGEFVDMFGNVVELGVSVGGAIVTSAGQVVDLGVTAVGNQMDKVAEVSAHVVNCVRSMDVCHDDSLFTLITGENGRVCPSCWVSKPVCYQCPYRKVCVRDPLNGFNSTCVGVGDLLKEADEVAIAGLVLGLDVTGQVLNAAGQLAVGAMEIGFNAAGQVINATGHVLQLGVDAAGVVVNATGQAVSFGINAAGAAVTFGVDAAGQVVMIGVDAAGQAINITANAVGNAVRFGVAVAKRHLQCAENLMDLHSCETNAIPEFGVDQSVSLFCPSCRMLRPVCDPSCFNTTTQICARDIFNGFEPTCMGVGKFVIRLVGATVDGIAFMSGLVSKTVEVVGELLRGLVEDLALTFCSVPINNPTCQFADALIEALTVLNFEFEASSSGITFEINWARHESIGAEETLQVSKLVHAALEANGEGDFAYDVIDELVDETTTTSGRRGEGTNTKITGRTEDTVDDEGELNGADRAGFPPVLLLSLLATGLSAYIY